MKSLQVGTGGHLDEHCSLLLVSLGALDEKDDKCHPTHKKQPNACVFGKLPLYSTVGLRNGRQAYPQRSGEHYYRARE